MHALRVIQIFTTCDSTEAMVKSTRKVQMVSTLLLLFVMRWEIPVMSFGRACRDWIPPAAPCF